jgi:hypothetical protein
VFGLNEYEQHLPPDADFAVVSSGGFHTVALKLDGSLAAWGWNACGQCNVPSGKGYVAVAAGGRHSIALKCDLSTTAENSETYRQHDEAAAIDVLAIARGIYYQLALFGEPTILLLLGLTATLLCGWHRPIIKAPARYRSR